MAQCGSASVLGGVGLADSVPQKLDMEISFFTPIARAITNILERSSNDTLAKQGNRLIKVCIYIFHHFEAFAYQSFAAPEGTKYPRFRHILSDSFQLLADLWLDPLKR